MNLSELRHTLVASIELAAPDTISMRTLIRRAGGAAGLREMNAGSAARALRKAAAEVQKERKGSKTAGPSKVSTSAITSWASKNAKGGSDSPAPPDRKPNHTKNPHKQQHRAPVGSKQAPVRANVPTEEFPTEYATVTRLV